MNVVAPTAAVSHATMANAIRFLAMDAVEKAKSGHPGMPMGMADVATVLFTKFLKFDPAAPPLARPRPLRALGRPRVDAALCAALSDRLSGHDDRGDQALPPARLARPPAIPSTATRSASRPPTGPLGQGLATAVGMAIAERALAARYRRPRRPPHLRHRRRRLPDGGRQPRGDRPRRPPEARPA